jgi:hypothetical protein
LAATRAADIFVEGMLFGRMTGSKAQVIAPRMRSAELTRLYIAARHG